MPTGFRYYELHLPETGQPTIREFARVPSWVERFHRPERVGRVWRFASDWDRREAVDYLCIRACQDLMRESNTTKNKVLDLTYWLMRGRNEPATNPEGQPDFCPEP